MASSPLTQWLRDDPIVVTGMGVHCAAGCGVDELWQSALDGRVSSEGLKLHGGGQFPVCAAPEIEAGDDRRLRAGRTADRSVQLALAAALQAFDGAGDIGGVGLSVIAGSSRGPQLQWEAAMEELASGRRMRPTRAATGTVACLSGLITQQLGATGPGFTVSATCASAANAIALGAQQLLLGEADAVLAGGSDAPVHPLVLRGMESAGMLGSSCRPFDADRDGLVVGEGAAFLLMERRSRAEARGAEVFASLAGWATGVNTSGRTGIREDGEGLVDVVERSLEIGALGADEIGYINAHGTATELNDRVEANTIARIFGAQTPTSSTKAVTGHCLGATPAIEAIVAIKALNHGTLPPTAGLKTVASECAGIDHISGVAREAQVKFALSTSIGFWGYHACLVFGQG